MWYLVIVLIVALAGWAFAIAQYRRGSAEAKQEVAERTADVLLEEVKRKNTHLTDDDISNGLLLWAESLRKS